MKRIRKTAHNYWDYDIPTQEHYLNIRYQYGYLNAGYWLKYHGVLSKSISIVVNSVITSMVLDLTIKSLKESGVMK